MEHSWAKYVRSLLTPFRFRSLLTWLGTGESRVAAEPELLERPSPKAKGRTRKSRGPTIASLRKKVERAKLGNNGPNIGRMGHAERNKILFGN